MPLVSQLPPFPKRQIPWLPSFSETVLFPLRHRCGLSQSFCEWAYQILLWVPRAKEPLTVQKGGHQNTGSHIPPTSIRASELEPNPLCELGEFQVDMESFCKMAWRTCSCVIFKEGTVLNPCIHYLRGRQLLGELDPEPRHYPLPVSLTF